MIITSSILKDVKEAIGLDSESNDFDTDILMHINASIAELNQNGVGKFIIVTDSTQTWADLQDETQTIGNEYFKMVPLYIAVKTKLSFDPPPPSSAQYQSANADKILWRLKVAYEEV